jgi:hypothetical protein
MATAKVTKHQEEKIVKTIVEKNEIVLTLSEEEARTIATLCSTVSGCTKTSLRKYSESVNQALCEQNIFSYGTKSHEQTRDYRFTPNWLPPSA